MDIPRKTPSPSGSPGDGAIGYLDIMVKKSFGREELLKIPIPPPGAREPMATSKQKDQLMVLGIIDAGSIQNLGSGQAGYIIDQILIERKRNRSGCFGGAAGFLLVAVIVVAVFVAPMLMNMNHDARHQGDEASSAWTQRGFKSKAQSPTSSGTSSAASWPPRYIPGLSPEALYEALELKQRGFSFEPPDSSALAQWTFKLTTDGKTYEVVLHGQGAERIVSLEAQITVDQGYDVNGPTQTFFGSVASMGSTSESALAAQKWVKDHSNTSEGATFGALHFQMAAKMPRQRRLMISASNGQP